MEYPKLEATEVLQICNEVIELQEKMRNCYFWEPGGNRRSREKREEWNSQVFFFSYGENHYTFIQKTSMSYRNCYFSSCFQINGVQKNLRLVRKLLKEVEQDLAKDAQQEEIIER